MLLGDIVIYSILTLLNLSLPGSFRHSFRRPGAFRAWPRVGPPIPKDIRIDSVIGLRVCGLQVSVAAEEELYT